MTSTRPVMQTDPSARQVPACATRSLTIQARHELTLGRRQPALALLRCALTRTTPGTITPDADRIVAAQLYALALAPHERGNWVSLQWARYAHHASTALFGSHDTRTIRTARTLAQVMAAYNIEDAAIALREQIVAQLTDRDGPDSASVLAARVSLATAQHAAGHCQAAIAGLTETWHRWQRHHGHSDPGSIAILLRLAAMRDACGQHAAAARLAVQAMQARRSQDRPVPPAPAWLDTGWITEPDLGHAVLCRVVPDSGQPAGGRPDRRGQAQPWRRRAAAHHPGDRSDSWRELLR